MKSTTCSITGNIENSLYLYADLVDVVRAETRERRETLEKLATVISFHGLLGSDFKRFHDQVALLLNVPSSELGRLVRSAYFGVWLKALGKWTCVNMQANQSDGCNASGNGHAGHNNFPWLDFEALQNLADNRLVREENIPEMMRVVIPPSYTFRYGYSADYVVPKGQLKYETAVNTALRSIEYKMPELRKLVNLFVSNILILNDVGFRSCSASRYKGMVLLSTCDQSLVEIEESIVHETGHQFLYYIDKHNPVFNTRDDTEKIVLPWSGSTRNYFGFFHATYIYLILRDYFIESVDKHPFGKSAAAERLEQVQTGLNKSTSLLKTYYELLTPYGQETADSMVLHIAKNSP